MTYVNGEHMHSLSIWRDAIVLRTDSSLPLSLQKYCRYNDKFNGYLFTFSAQNLRRIRLEYGELPCHQGGEKIDWLRSRFVEFTEMTKVSQTLKASTELSPLNYKVPPLGYYQHRGAHLLKTVKRFPLFASCGVGKTWMVIVSTQFQLDEGILEPGKTLVCGKLATLETGWMEDVQKFSNMKASLVWLPATSKRKEKLIKLLDEPADIYITNHDTLRVLEEELVAKRFKKVVIDESTILKSYHGDFTKKGGSIGKALMRVSEHADWRVIMSGTPAPNGPHDLWGQFRFLDPDGFLLEPNFHNFRERFMEEVFFGKKPDENAVPLFQSGPKVKSTWVPRKGASKEIGDIIAPLSYRVEIREHLHDLPAKTTMRIPVRMTDEQQKHYIDMRDNLATMIDDQFVAIDVKLAQIGKLRQITGGFLIDQTEAIHVIEDSPKLLALDDLLEEIGDQKVIIYAQYRWEIKTIAERYKDRGVVTVFGENKSQDNLENIKAFIQNPDVKVIVLHPKSAAHGITFTVCHYMIFYSSSFSAEDDYQCVARIERAGQKNPMFIYYLLAKFNKEPKKGVSFTIDEVIYSVLQQKIKDQKQLIDQRAIDLEILKQI